MSKIGPSENLKRGNLTVQDENIEIKTLKQNILESIKSKQFDKAEKFFMDFIKSEEASIENCTNIAQSFDKAKQGKRLQNLAGIHLLDLLDRKEYEIIYNLAKMYIEHINDGTDVHEPLVTAIQNIYSSNPNLKRYLRASGLNNGNNLKEEIKLFEKILYCDEGCVFEHHSWGIGVVTEVNTLEQKVIVDFTNEKNKEMTFDGVFEFLIKIPNNHFKALKLKDIEELRNKAKENPAEFVKFLLMCYGNCLKSNEIKSLYLEILPESSWEDWWKKAKDVLRFDTKIKLKEGLQSEVKFRNEEKDFYDDLLEQIYDADEFEERCNFTRMFIKHKKLQAPKDEQIHSLVSFLKSEFNSYDNNPSKQIKYYYLYNELTHEFPNNHPVLSPTAEDIIKSSDDLGAILLNMPFSEYQIDTAKKITEILDPEKWMNIFSKLFPQAPVKLSAFMAEQLYKNEDKGGIDYLNQASHILYQDYKKNPEVFIWLARQILLGTYELVSTGVSIYELFLELIHYLEELKQLSKSDDMEARKIQSQIRAIINEKKFSIPIKLYKNASVHDAKRISEAMVTSPALLSTVKSSLTDIFSRSRDDIKFADKAETQETAPQNFYVTKESFDRKQSELQHLMAVEIPKNSKDIEVAREKGDLKENAEYDAAKNKQGLLMTQVKELQEQISRARIINPDIVSNEAILVGNNFRILNLVSQKEEFYTLLGPWDAKVDKGIISYLSPFGAQFINHKVDDIFKLKHPDGTESEYKILEIGNALKS